MDPVEKKKYLLKYLNDMWKREPTAPRIKLMYCNNKPFITTDDSKSVHYFISSYRTNAIFENIIYVVVKSKCIIRDNIYLVEDMMSVLPITCRKIMSPRESYILNHMLKDFDFSLLLQ